MRPREVLVCNQDFLRRTPAFFSSSHRLFSSSSSSSSSPSSSPSSESLDDYYEILGITPNANPKEIKAAYIAKSKLYHPDNNHGKEADAQQKFIKVATAYKTLKSRRHRSEYDVDLGLDRGVQILLLLFLLPPAKRCCCCCCCYRIDTDVEVISFMIIVFAAVVDVTEVKMLN